MHIINTLGPVFMIIAMGAVLRRAEFLSDSLLRGMNRLAYWVGLPCLLFVKIATAPAPDQSAGLTFLVLLIATCGLIAVSLACALCMRMRAESVGSFVQMGFRGNLAYVGLPVVFFAFANSAAADSAGRDAQALAALAIAPLIVFYNAAAVIALLASRHKMGLAALKKMAWQIATNPLLLACVAAIAWSALSARLKFEMPISARRTLEMTGQFTLPVALLSVGGSLIAAGVRGRILTSLAATIIKTGLGPAFGYLAARLLGATPQATTVAMIMLACPTAVASYILADQLEGDVPMTAGAIVISTILSIVSLSVVIAIN